MKFEEVHLHDLKQKAPAELLSIAEDLEIENASMLRKQDMMFAILKELAEQEVPITGDTTSPSSTSRVRRSCCC